MPVKKKETAKEFMERLRTDPEYQARVADRDRKLAERVAELRKAEEPLIQELNAAGFDVATASDLFNRKEPWNKKDHIRPYPEGVPILLKHLERPYPSPVREDIVRALTDAAARGIANKPMLKAFKTEKDEKLRWVIGNALAVLAQEQDLPEILQLVRDESYGRSRMMLVEAVGRLMGEDSISMLISWLDDTDLSGVAIMELGKLKAKEAKPFIEPFREHKNQWHREVAREALRKIS